MAIGIYKITNKLDGKVYIGQSRNTASRWYQHKRAAAGPINGNNSYLVRSMRLHGVSNFTFEIIEECLVEQLNDREIYWIKYFNSTDSNIGYNYNAGGQYKHGDSSKAIFRLTLKQVVEITNHLQDCKLSMTDIADKYNTSLSSIRNINTGLTWTRDDVAYPIRVHRLRRGIPNREELISSLLKYGYPTTYRKWNAKLATLKRWCHMYNIPDNYQEFIIWYNQENQTNSDIDAAK